MRHLNIYIFILKFANGLRDRGSTPGQVRLRKWYLIPHCLTLSIKSYESRVSRTSSERIRTLLYTWM